MLRCEKCKHVDVSAEKYPCVECDSMKNDLFEPKKFTNADRIRSMSDEELAEFLVTVETYGYYDQSVSGTLEVFEWLQSEVEE